MGGKTKTTQSSTSQSKAYDAVAPTINTGAGIMNSYLENPNSNAVYDGPRVADLSADTQAGLDMLRGSQGANTAFDFYDGLIGSGAGTMNPQVQAMQDAIKRQVMAATNATFSNSGTVGGTAHQESLAKGLADGMAQPLFAAYENDMGRKMQAATGIQAADQLRTNNRLDAGSILDSYNQNKINADMAKFEEQRTAPIKAWSEIFPMVSDLGSRFGTNSSTSTTTQKTPMSQQIAGGVMAGLGLMTGMPGLGMAGAGMMGGSAAPWVRPSTPYASNSMFNLNQLYGG